MREIVMAGRVPEQISKEELGLSQVSFPQLAKKGA